MADITVLRQKKIGEKYVSMPSENLFFERREFEE